ncbi:hypothetical protein [Catellatospora paridis]|uniref:hypothetical protein n=1 Tax=Catellatospora paridis TaxID=1617086 RepID=UPI0012D40205|nr:hypothetical protein [Catellatospora paridis]
MSGSVPAGQARWTPDPVLAVLVVGAMVSVVAVPAASYATEVVKAGVWAVGVWLCQRVASSAQIAPTARRFWRTVSVGAAFLAAANVVLLSGYLRKPGAEPFEFAWEGLGVIGIAALGWATFAFPLKASDGARVRLRLDVATVVGPFAMLAWYLCLPRGSPPGSTGQIAVNTVGSVLALIAVCGAVKLLLSGSAPFTLGAGLSIGPLC